MSLDLSFLLQENESFLPPSEFLPSSSERTAESLADLFSANPP